jgi:septum formation protein
VHSTGADRPVLVLASASPARLRVLRGAGLDPLVSVSGVDEDGVDAGSPAATALELARRKARTVAARVSPGTLVLGCDSVLDLDGAALGKPVDAADARARWQRMRGREAVLHTGHCLLRAAVRSQAEVSDVASTVVRFAAVSDAEIDAYVRTGEPLHVAGAFTIDGLGGAFVEAVVGDPHNVVGVSLPLLRRLAAGLGVGWTSLWSPAASGGEAGLGGHAEPDTAPGRSG